MAKLTSYVCVYLVILKDENQILLSFRDGTKFANKTWALVAGHAEDGESAKQAMVREAKEEAGIDIDEKDLTAIYFMDRKTSVPPFVRQNIDIFFKCDKYLGEIQNKEPDKCGGIEFFETRNLPQNTLDYIKQAIEDIHDGRIYREIGY